jgi:hypothetical protein
MLMYLQTPASLYSQLTLDQINFLIQEYVYEGREMVKVEYAIQRR